MTAPAQALERIAAARLIAIVRTGDLDEALRVTESLHGAGVGIVEYSLAGDAALAAIRACRERFGDAVLLGAGTVLTGQQAAVAVDAGADFLIAPNVDEEVMESASGLGVLHIPGALTPTEIALASRLGAAGGEAVPGRAAGSGLRARPARAASRPAADRHRGRLGRQRRRVPGGRMHRGGGRRRAGGWRSGRGAAPGGRHLTFDGDPRTMQRNPMWLVEVSTACGIRAAGR